MISSRASSHHCQQEQRRVVARQHARRRRVNMAMGKEFLPLDSPTQDVVELKQEQEQEHYAFKISDNTPSDVAAPLLCTGTMVSTQTKEVGIKPGDRVGVVFVFQ
ncbi:hypothetical protein PF002_g13272 [Phytophthora fragariae]|uniref:Uncharacterized protein n=1 Tax=Phytophthora fragariae TaxID=53985 RepID=A0A6A3Z5I5_9STRA|nr:hypothetical protein PF002_g13272 [Phytophthora fragariae]